MSSPTALPTEAATDVEGDGVLINPHSYDGAGLDPESARLLSLIHI